MTNKRPACPGCGKGNPKSHGLYWECRHCGRSWKKHYRKKVEPNWEERGKCPSCGAMRMKRHGINGLECTICGRGITIYRKVVNHPICNMQEVIRG